MPSTIEVVRPSGTGRRGTARRTHRPIREQQQVKAVHSPDDVEQPQTPSESNCRKAGQPGNAGKAARYPWKGHGVGGVWPNCLQARSWKNLASWPT